MDEDHLLTTARYMELNPVRAGSVQAPSRYSWRGSAVAHVRGHGLSRRRFHGGFHAYLLLLIDWWGPLSHRPSATKPITSHEAVWPSQGQPCSVPALPSHAANLLSFLTRRTQTSLARLATRTRSARCASRAATSSFRAESRATGRNWIRSPGESWPTRSRSAEMMCAT